MLQVPATEAKQRFGELLRRASLEPVAIERHSRVEAVMVPPDFFAKAHEADSQLAQRKLARANQALVERDRLIRHHEIARDLLSLPGRKRQALIRYARESVRQWRERRLCSPDYISRWTQILELPTAELARAITSDLEGWGPALRQNSPWNGVLPE